MSILKVRRQFINAKSGQLHLRVADSFSETASPKTAIICMHMVPKSGRIFQSLLPELAKDRLVIAPDYPGYGESDHYQEISQPGIDDYADSISEVVSHFNLDQVDLVGYHTGSMVAVNIASRYPKLVRKLINISAPILTNEEVDAFHKYFAPIPLDEEGTRLRIMWERVMQYRGPGMTLEMAAESMAENLRGGERYEDGHHAAFAYAKTYAEKITQIDQPLWVMNPNDDLYEHTKRVDAYLKNGSRSDFLDWGHGFLSIWPEKTATEMLKFLDS